jgi:uncharacterized protein (DUF58 family)
MTEARLNPKAFRALFGWLTPRGRSLAAAGAGAIAGGLAIPEPGLVRVGALLVALPLLSALTILRPRYLLSCSRRLDPPRVPAGQQATVTTRVENVCARRTGVLLTQDVTPGALGSGPRFVLDEIEPGGHREISYQVCARTRGTFTIGPLRVRAADAFGLVQIGRPFGVTSTLVVTPRIIELPQSAARGGRLGESDIGIATIAVSGEDDAGPRAYRHGDGLHRVHWKSTARRGELMVRGEEGQRRASASVFLDTRRSAHSGDGPASTFEFAVSAAASIGAHLSGKGLQAGLVTGAGDIGPHGSGAGGDTLLDMLAVIGPSGDDRLQSGTSALGRADGQLIAVLGRMSLDDARQLAASRRGNAPAVALLLAVSGWGSDTIEEDTARAAQVLAAAGWRVAVVTAGTRLAAAWQQLQRPVGKPVTPRDPVGFGSEYL